MVLPLVLLVAAAYAEWATVGLPALSPAPLMRDLAAPRGFPLWLRITHYVNFVCLILLIRSGVDRKSVV